MTFSVFSEIRERLLFNHIPIKDYKESPEKLAACFFRYFPQYLNSLPVNPFEILKDFGVKIVFCDFDNLEGIFIPAKDSNQKHLVAINANRPITRQRFTAAHELCHLIKDSNSKTDIRCLISSDSEIEVYANRFASELIMPSSMLMEHLNSKNITRRSLSESKIVRIAHLFGASFQACCIKLKSIYSELSYVKIKKYFKPEKERKLQKLTYFRLYQQLIDSWEDLVLKNREKFSLFLFKNKYIFNDSRLEGIDATYESVAEIIKDLFLNKQKSIYSNEKYSAYCSIAGHSKLYDWIFENYEKDSISIFCIMQLHKELFSFFAAPEFGGKMRQSNTLVVGAKFETLDWHDIPIKLTELDKAVKELDFNYNHYTKSEIILKIIKIHHELTVIHPFPDGNGRVSRAFMNLQLLRYGFLPFYIDLNIKNKYYEALYIADVTENVDELMCVAIQQMINTHVALQSKY